MSLANNIPVRTENPFQKNTSTIEAAPLWVLPKVIQEKVSYLTQHNPKESEPCCLLAALHILSVCAGRSVEINLGSETPSLFLFLKGQEGKETALNSLVVAPSKEIEKVIQKVTKKRTPVITSRNTGNKGFANPLGLGYYTQSPAFRKGILKGGIDTDWKIKNTDLHYRGNTALFLGDHVEKITENQFKKCLFAGVSEHTAPRNQVTTPRVETEKAYLDFIVSNYLNNFFRAHNDIRTKIVLTVDDPRSNKFLDNLSKSVAETYSKRGFESKEYLNRLYIKTNTLKFAMILQNAYHQGNKQLQHQMLEYGHDLALYFQNQNRKFM